MIPQTAPEPQTVPAIAWHWLGNVRLSRVSFAQTLELIDGWAGCAPFRLIVTPNVDHVIHLQHNAAFREAYGQAALSLVDGRPVQWAAGYLGLPPFEKVSGSDLTPALCRLGAEKGWRVFFIGGRSEEELSLCLERIGQRYAGLKVGGYCPPLGFERDERETTRVVEAALAFAPDLILMGCGSPKSEIWMARQSEALGRAVGISCGAGLRFLAGIDRRAPRWIQRCGLEWAWRLAGDPCRLWKRYLVDDMKFFPLVWQWKHAKRS